MSKPDATKKMGPCLDAELLLPLKCLSYSVAPSAFLKQFQMSEFLMRDCQIQFDLIMEKLYQEEYLRLSTPEDLKIINKLHLNVRGRQGIFGSLDCMHVFWHKYSIAWQGSYKGAKGKPTVTLEAIPDYNLWFAHASFGYCGSLNDKTMLDLSPFLASLVDGSYCQKEKDSGLMPFRTCQEKINQLYILVDGIYPSFSRFVNEMKAPVYSKEKKFS